MRWHFSLTLFPWIINRPFSQFLIRVLARPFFSQLTGLNVALIYLSITQWKNHVHYSRNTDGDVLICFIPTAEQVHGSEVSSKRCTKYSDSKMQSTYVHSWRVFKMSWHSVSRIVLTTTTKPSGLVFFFYFRANILLILPNSVHKIWSTSIDEGLTRYSSCKVIMR